MAAPAMVFFGRTCFRYFHVLHHSQYRAQSPYRPRRHLHLPHEDSNALRAVLLSSDLPGAVHASSLLLSRIAGAPPAPPPETMLIADPAIFWQQLALRLARLLAIPPTTSTVQRDTRQVVGLRSASIPTMTLLVIVSSSTQWAVNHCVSRLAALATANRS